MIFTLLLLSSLASINAFKCSNGMSHGSSVTKKIIPATLPQFLSIVGRFFDDTWYNYPVKSTIGPENQVGSIRTIADLSNTLVFHETLIEYCSNAYFFKQAWKGPGDNVTSVNYGNFILGSYVEYISGKSICSDHSAVLVNFGIEFCAKNLSTATSVLAGGHAAGIQQIQTLLKIGNRTSCCKLDNKRSKVIPQSSNKHH